MSRKYTGWDKNASGKRAGLEKLVELTSQRFNNGVWNNGTWSVRNMNNPNLATPRPSVHGTGRAADMSWRKTGAKGFGDYQTALQVVDFWVANAELFLVEEIHDYFPAPFGRGWRCDRAQWTVYSKPSIGSAPGGDWFHVEIANDRADDAAYYEQAFAQVAGGVVIPSAPVVSNALPFPGVAIKLGAKGEQVKHIQRVVGATPDGGFGPKTEQLVIAWQSKNGLKPDGIVGQISWKKMFG